MFMHYASHGDANRSPYRRIVPQSFEGISFGGVGRTSDDVWDAKAVGLARYGGKNEGFSHYDTPKGNHMQVMTLSGYKPAIAEGTPGLVWDAAGVWAPVTKIVDQNTVIAPNMILISGQPFTEDMRKDLEKKARTTCSAIIKKQEGMLVKLVEARVKDRLAFLDKAKARLQGLGVQ
jgi:hypothetical protein